MTISIGINARLFQNNWRPAVHEITFAQAQGFSAIQFHGRETGLTADQLGDPIGVVAERLQAAGLEPVMEIVLRLGSNGRTFAQGLRPVEVLEANLPAITGLGCTRVHWHPVINEPDVPDEAIPELESSLLPELAEAVAIGQTHRFRFGFEHNSFGLRLLVGPDRCRRLLEAVPGLGFVWDFNHTLLQQLPDFLTLTPRMQQLHVSDTPLPETNYHWPLGRGNIEFAVYCQALLNRGYNGPAILEIGGQPLSGGYGQDTNEALAASHALLVQASTNGYRLPNRTNKEEP